MPETVTAASIPSFEELKAAAAALGRFDPRKVIYLDAGGSPAEGPATLRDRISHALLHDLGQAGGQSAGEVLAGALRALVSRGAWGAAAKLAAIKADGRPSGFAVLCGALVRIVEREAARLNAAAPAPDWDSRARAARADYRQAWLALNASWAERLSGEEHRALDGAAGLLLDGPDSSLARLAGLVAAQEKAWDSIERRLAGTPGQAAGEETWSAIVELLQPPMGIVTNLSPALFFPSLWLLIDPRVEVESGVPYAASVNLGIYRDPRSAEALLEALDRFPLSCTKVRENVIYALGGLGEGRAASRLIGVLGAPDEAVAPSAAGSTACLLLEQKEEAIWALGRIGREAIPAVPALAPYADHPSPRLRTYLGWTLGEIGRVQKEETGGLGADIVIALLKLLQDKNRQVFEEAVGALRKLGLPEFVHSLYLYNVGAVSTLGLKPAQRGLNELSETLHFLLRTKKRTVMAVNGDSGTGKTYFCQALAAGFGDVRPEEILYLMRDTKRGQKVFNRLLGLRWLRKHIDPAYYQDEAAGPAEDDPGSALESFLAENADKRLIILDGCRDRHYFQKVIDLFYARGELDVEVNFRATFSTRRLNLEEREKAVESVKLHLAFLEEPALEDTSFYQEGLVILYDLDNSLAARLDRDETRQVFDVQRIDGWGELIRIGGFGDEKRTADCRRAGLTVKQEPFETEAEAWPAWRERPFSPGERMLKPVLNRNLRAQPHLLETVPLGGLEARRLRFYAQDQVAGLTAGGEAFVLTFLDHRVFLAPPRAVSDFALLGRTFYLIGPDGRLAGLSFEKNETADTGPPAAASLRIAALPPDRIVTAGADGRITVWDFLEKERLSFASGWEAVTALAVDQGGRIVASGGPGSLRRWDLAGRRLEIIDGPTGAVRFLRPYPRGGILAVEAGGSPDSPDALRLFDIEAGETRTTPLPAGRPATGVNVYFDGRIVISCGARDPATGGDPGTLFVVSPEAGGCTYLSIPGHPRGTDDCLAMGPRIVSCGREPGGGSAVRVWGSEFYVRTELGKLFIKS